MSIKIRLWLLLGGLLIGLLAAMFSLQWLENRATKDLRDDARQTRVQELSRWLDITSRSLAQSAGDLAQSEQFLQLSAHPSGDASVKIASELAKNKVQSLWVLNAGGEPVFHVQADTALTQDQLLLPPEDFSALVGETPSPHFFAEQNHDLFEVCVRRINVSTEPRWLLVSRLWNESHLHGIGSLTEGTASLVSAREIAQTPADDRLVLLRPLNDWQGHPLRVLRLEYEDKTPGSMLQTDSWQARIFIVFGLLVLVALGLALQQWVLHPLRQISTSLAQNDTAPIHALKKAKDEFGRVAQLVESSFAQHAELRQTLADRARLGRDLHDGVIQSLYAAGMGLASVHTLLPPEQAEASIRIEQTRTALNETIRDVRNFITGLEPEALKQQSFTHAVASLLDFMQSIGPIRTSVDIDEHIATSLTMSQRVHALQIAREAASNAIRHGEARHVKVSLQARGSSAEFEIRDDGKGFDPAERTSSGHGLGNFALRARELGAVFAIDSAPGLGTRIKLTFPLPT
ncbi:MAG TPA: sensor histidine kinase [Rariglobus sp.]|jgi:signal transduction histidine kinase|nr:sensor histidine kinase [Rariglobus sp.]